jgi:hypothetical protein
VNPYDRRHKRAAFSRQDGNNRALRREMAAIRAKSRLFGPEIVAGRPETKSGIRHPPDGIVQNPA